MIPNNWRAFPDLIPLLLQLIFSEWLFLKFCYSPPWCFKAQPLIARERTSSLEMPQNLMVPVSQDRNIFPANRAVKITHLICCVSWPSDEEFSEFARPMNLLKPDCLFGQIFPAAPAVVRLILASTKCFGCSLRAPFLFLASLIKNFIQYC